MLVRLIYASTATEGVGMTEFKGILQQSQANNHRRDLTGVLAFNSKVFLQGLEGSREQINELYSRLMRDTRHHTVSVLEYAEIEERDWSQWSMGFAAQSADNRALFLKYSGESVFNPYAMRGNAVKKMLGELVGKSISMTVPVPVSPTAFAAPAASAITPLAPRSAPPVPRPPVPVSTAAAAAPARPTTAAAPLSPSTATPASTGLLGRLLNR